MNCGSSFLVPRVGMQCVTVVFPDYTHLYVIHGKYRLKQYDMNKDGIM